MLADEAVVRRCYEVLLARALRLTGSRDAALDLVQDTLERCLRCPPDTSTGKLEHWLSVVMRRIFIDGRRRPTSRCQEFREDEFPESAQLDEDRPAWQTFPAGTVRATLDLLPDWLRKPYEMHAMEEVPYHRIAQVLGVRVGTVSSRIFRARRRLREALLSWPPSPRSAA